MENVAMELPGAVFARHLAALQERRGWSDSELARRSGVSNRTIGVYKRNESVPSIDNADRIGRALGFPGWLLQVPGLDPMHPTPLKGLHRLIEAYGQACEAGRDALDAQVALLLSISSDDEQK
jgi:transcriptional regulator with XRE-family HTH domain